MKAITEEILRYELRNTQPEVYVVPEGKILTPAAREYLQQRKIAFEIEGSRHIVKAARVVATDVPPETEVEVPETVQDTDAKISTVESPAESVKPAGAPQPLPSKPKYVDYDSRAYYYEKPEQMTQLFGNELVPKDHPRILFRGKLDSLQALVVFAQAMIANGSDSVSLIDDLGDILRALREIMRCDVLDEELKASRIIGLTHAELRERSHDPMKFYNIKQMVLPDYTMGAEYALLNQIRTAVRETEVAACIAFHEGKKYVRTDIIEELNRLSSAMHIMMCKHLAGDYR